MGSTVIRFINLPWTYTRQDLGRYLSKTLDTQVKWSHVLYDKQTGLSRGIGLARLGDESLARDVIRRGIIEVEGRQVVALHDSVSKKSSQ